MHRLAIILMALITAAHVGGARGQPALSPHGWFVLPAEPPLDQEGGDRETEARGVLIHLPPRVPMAQASPAPDLRLARIARLPQTPQWLVAAGDSVFAVLPADEQGFSRVGRSRVYPRGLRDLWGSSPARRLEVLPGIEDEVLAAATDGESLFALTRVSEGIEVQRLDPQGWAPLGPAFQPTEFDQAGLVLAGGAPSVAMIRGSEVEWALLSADGWRRESAGTLPGESTSSIDVVGSYAGELIAIADQGDSRLGVISIGSHGIRSIGDVQLAAYEAVAVLPMSGRLVFAWREAESEAAGESALPQPGLRQRAVSMLEFSLITGRVLASGPATVSSPVSRGEFQSLAILLFACMVLVLIVVVRPLPTSAEPVLPPGTAIATTGRRFAASLVDGLIAAFVTSRLLGLPVLETLGPLALPLTGSVNIAPLVMVLSLASAHSAIGEMLTGRSIGKSLTGIFVARVDPSPGSEMVPGRFRPPTPGGAILRNILKWFLFPAAAIVMSDPSGRHRGDLVARAAVLMPVPVEER